MLHIGLPFTDSELVNLNAVVQKLAFELAEKQRLSFLVETWIRYDSYLIRSFFDHMQSKHADPSLVSWTSKNRLQTLRAL